MTADRQGVDPDLVAMMRTVFSDYRASLVTVARPDELDGELWKRLESLGLTRLTGDAERGGSGATWREAAQLLRAAAANAVALPLLEHDLLAGWLLREAGLPADDQIRTACLLDDEGGARAVPWAGVVARVVVGWRAGDEWRVADVPRDAIEVVPGRNVAGERRDMVRVDTSALTSSRVGPDVAAMFVSRGALGRTVQLCGALETIVELCRGYTAERVQFGRKLAQFQAVQRLVAQVAAETWLAQAVTDAAVDAMAGDDRPAEAIKWAVAVAKSCAGHAAEVVVRNAHQIHGALGTTAEHALHRFTTPALAWRAEFGSLRHWDDYLLSRAMSAGPSAAWPLMVMDEEDSGAGQHE